MAVCTWDENSEEYFRSFGSPYLTAEEEEAFSSVFTQYIFYDSYGMRNYRACICTICGQFELYRSDNPGFFRHKHGDATECPHCGGVVQLYALGRMKTGSGLTEEHRATFLRRGPGGVILAVSGWGRKEYHWDDLRPGVQWEERVRTWLEPGRVMQWWRSWNAAWDIRYPASGWSRTEKNVREPFNGTMYQVAAYYLFGVENLQGSALQYCQIEEWYRNETGVRIEEQQDTVFNCVKYIAEYCLHPQMEMAVKLGFFHAVTDLIGGKKNAKILNWKADSIAGFLRMTKPDAKTAVRAGLNFQALEAFHTCKKAEPSINLEKFMELREKAGGNSGVTALSALAKRCGVTLRQAANYIGSQQPECPRYAVPVSTILQYWKDYLDMAQRLNYDMGRRDVLMPKELKERHDAAAGTIKAQETVEEVKKYRKRYQALRKQYEFAWDGLRIVVPETSSEIINEGKALQHCVGGYADRHILGYATILFLRKEEKPDEPYVTIEMAVNRPDSVIQAHGFANERKSKNGETPVPPMEKHREFFDVWLGWVRSGSKRDGNGRPILLQNRKKEEKTA